MATVTKKDSRYEIEVDGQRVGLADYSVDGDVVTMPHTEVDKEFGGRGLAGELVQYALDDIRDQGLKVNPVCPYVAKWIQKHPDYSDLRA
ncbi:GNAT family N-acetyltransferase [Nigerium massiliense]|uniref:GNAT family N-acetyltransferase n=1 Tax=Nigerium massiliense TaxID=1522317 RepID=UPI0005908871|nr:GNAT family N-acetyltransferase [Nigerium massiliense]